MATTEEGSYRWAWGELVTELDERLKLYKGKEADLTAEARGWLHCLQFMRRKTKVLMRKLNRLEGAGRTLGSAADEMWAQLRDDGKTHCACCGRLMQVYRRSIHHEMAYFLIWLVYQYEAGKEWVHISAFPRSRSGDYAKLMYWNLIEPKPKEDDPEKRESGWWRPTREGIAFAHSHAAVPKHALVFDNEVQRLAGGHIFIREALGKHFVYEEVVQEVRHAVKWPETANSEKIR